MAYTSSSASVRYTQKIEVQALESSLAFLGMGSNTIDSAHALAELTGIARFIINHREELGRNSSGMSFEIPDDYVELYLRQIGLNHLQSRQFVDYLIGLVQSTDDIKDSSALTEWIKKTSESAPKQSQKLGFELTQPQGFLFGIAALILGGADRLDWTHRDEKFDTASDLLRERGLIDYEKVYKPLAEYWSSLQQPPLGIPPRGRIK